jgi:hypothetical protein
MIANTTSLVTSTQDRISKLKASILSIQLGIIPEILGVPNLRAAADLINAAVSAPVKAGRHVVAAVKTRVRAKGYRFVGDATYAKVEADLRAANGSTREIANRHGLSTSAVSVRKLKMGLVHHVGAPVAVPA